MAKSTLEHVKELEEWLLFWNTQTGQEDLIRNEILRKVRTIKKSIEGRCTSVNSVR